MLAPLPLRNVRFNATGWVPPASSRRRARWYNADDEVLEVMLMPQAFGLRSLRLDDVAVVRDGTRAPKSRTAFGGSALGRAIPLVVVLAACRRDARPAASPAPASQPSAPAAPAPALSPPPAATS